MFKTESEDYIDKKSKTLSNTQKNNKRHKVETKLLMKAVYPIVSSNVDERTDIKIIV